MNNSFARLVEGMCHQLQHEVLPRLADEYARSQLWGVINALNTFGMRADWSAGFLLAQIEAQRQALAAADAALGTAFAAEAGADAAPAAPPTTAALLAARDRGNAAITLALAHLAETNEPTAPAGGDAQARARALAALREAMRAEVQIELRHSPRPLFAQMSGQDQG